LAAHNQIRVNLPVSREIDFLTNTIKAGLLLGIYYYTGAPATIIFAVINVAQACSDNHFERHLGLYAPFLNAGLFASMFFDNNLAPIAILTGTQAMQYSISAFTSSTQKRLISKYALQKSFDAVQIISLSSNFLSLFSPAPMLLASDSTHDSLFVEAYPSSSSLSTNAFAQADFSFIRPFCDQFNETRGNTSLFLSFLPANHNLPICYQPIPLHNVVTNPDLCSFIQENPLLALPTYLTTAEFISDVQGRSLNLSSDIRALLNHWSYASHYSSFKANESLQIYFRFQKNCSQGLRKTAFQSMDLISSYADIVFTNVQEDSHFGTVLVFMEEEINYWAGYYSPEFSLAKNANCSFFFHEHNVRTQPEYNSSLRVVGHEMLHQFFKHPHDEAVDNFSVQNWGLTITDTIMSYHSIGHLHYLAFTSIPGIDANFSKNIYHTLTNSTANTSFLKNSISYYRGLLDTLNLTTEQLDGVMQIITRVADLPFPNDIPAAFMPLDVLALQAIFGPPRKLAPVYCHFELQSEEASAYALWGLESLSTRLCPDRFLLDLYPLHWQRCVDTYRALIEPPPFIHIGPQGGTICVYQNQTIFLKDLKECLFFMVFPSQENPIINLSFINSVTPNLLKIIVNTTQNSMPSTTCTQNNLHVSLNNPSQRFMLNLNSNLNDFTCNDFLAALSFQLLETCGDQDCKVELSSQIVSIITKIFTEMPYVFFIYPGFALCLVLSGICIICGCRQGQQQHHHHHHHHHQGIMLQNTGLIVVNLQQPV
jgi:hypothetical protein